MNLYHFTAAEYLPLIQQNGIWKGEVAITPTKLMNAVWLTSDGNPDGHGLTDGRDLTEREKLLFRLPPDMAAKFPNKRAIRLTVKIPRGDRRLNHWPQWARSRLTRDWYATLDRTGGGKSRTWYLYWGTIPVEWIVETAILRAAPPGSLGDVNASLC